MPNRGIKVFKVPGDYATLDDVINSNTQQYRDIVMIRPSDYNQKMLIYQFTYDIYDSLYPKLIKDYEWDDLQNDIDIVFTDNELIANVTPIRKAHQEDYRNILTFLKNVSVNKYGDFLEGNFNLTNSKFRWNNGTYASELFLDADTSDFRLNISEDTILNISKIDTDFNNLSKLLTLSSEYLNIFVDTDIDGKLSVTGDASLKSNVTLNESDGTTTINGATAINNNLTVAQNTSIGGNLSVGEDVTIDGNTDVDGNLNVGEDAGIHGSLNVTETVSADKISANIIDVYNSEHSEIVTGFNADKLDNYHADELISYIISKFPTFPKIFNFLETPVDIVPSGNNVWMDVTLTNIVPKEASSVILLINIYNAWRVNATYVQYMYNGNSIDIAYTADDDSRGQNISQHFLPFDNENMKFTWRWFSTGGGVNSFKILGYTL